MAWNILGIGSPLVDLLTNVDDAFLKEHVSGAKGGMEMVESSAISAILSAAEGTVHRAPGGSAGNTVFALARMGCSCSMFGKVGEDSDGTFYCDSFRKAGGSDKCFVKTAKAATGNCLSLVTPDAERTMRSALGASLLLEVKDLEGVDFSAFDMVYFEGYMLYSPVFDTAVEKAKKAHCRIALDLGSFEVVGAFREKLQKLLPESVDLVFANADEADALLGKAPAAEQAAKLAEMCEVAVVKSGVKGSIARRGSEVAVIPAFVVEHPVDTTAAGDLYAAGFLRGLASGASLADCGRLASRISAEVVKVVGSVLPESSWKIVFDEMKGF